ncbi:MAG: response regulator [Pseudomonadota bacterium]
MLACALPTILGFGALSYDLYQRERGDVLKDATGMVRALLLAFERDLDNGEAAARALASSPSLASGNLAAFHAQAASLLRPGLPAVAFVLSDGAGKALLDTRTPYGQPLAGNGNAGQVRAVFRSGQTAASDLFRAKPGARPLMSIDVPVLREGEPAYVLSVLFEPASMGRLLEAQHIPDGWTMAIVDGQDRIVARSLDPARYVGAAINPVLAAGARRAASGRLETSTRENVRVDTVFVRSPARGWLAVVSVPAAAASWAVIHSLGLMLAVVAALLVTGFGTAWWIGGAIGRSVRALCGPAIALGRGEPLEIAPLQIREAAEVAEALRQLERELSGYRSDLEGLVEERTRQMQRSNTLLSTVYATAPVGLCMLDLELRVVMVNDYLAAINGKPVAEHTGRTLPELLGPIGLEFEHSYRQVLADGVALTGIETSGVLPHAPHAERQWLVSYYPVFEHDTQQLVGVSAVVLDITEQKALDLRMRDNDEQFTALYEQSGDAHMLVALGAGFVGGNKAAAAIFGCADIEQFLTLSPATTSPEFQPDGRRSDEKAQEFMRHALEHGSNHFEWLHQRTDGSLFDADVLLTSLNIGGKGVMLATVRDISARIAAEAALRAASEQLAQSERFLRTVTDNVPGMVAYWDAGLRCRFVNRHYIDWFGRDDHAMLGAPMEEVLGKALMAQNAPALRAVFSGQAQHFEREMGGPDGALHYLWTSYIPDFDGQGEVRGLFVLKYDITERKQIELRLQHVNEQLVQALDRAEMASSAKSEFLANMSHEIRTPMNAIMGLARLLEEGPLGARERGYVAKMKRSTRSLLGILNDVLDFSKIEAGQLTLESTGFRLDQVFESISVLVASNAWQKGVEPIFAVAPEVPLELVGDPMRIEQVLLNLIGNAIKFTASGEVVLAVRVLERDAASVRLEFEVRDSGIGIDPAEQPAIFDAFSQGDSSTSRKHGGTGLGLAICRRLVNLMGGQIGVRSALGAGATFHFDCSFGAAPEAPLLAASSHPELAGLSLLLVDDNASAGAALAGACRALGMQVVQASSGVAALELLRAPGQAFELMLLDSAMPDLDGVSVLTYARADAAIAVPRCALMLPDEQRERLLALADDIGFDALLCKPVTPGALLAAIAELCTGEAPAGTPAEAPLTGRLSGIHVLLVEDNEINQEVANYLLQHAGARVDIAANGQEALTMLAETPGRYDAVLMDIQMPVMNGYEATDAIRRMGLTELPIIAMTANAMDEDRQHALEVGMNGHLAKPIEVDLLVSTLNRLTGGGEAREQELATHSGYSYSGAPPGAMPLPAHIPGIDLHSTLPRFGGNFASFVSLFKRFESSQGGTLSEVRNLLRGADRHSAIQLVHRLRGVAANLGATGLAEHALEFEHALRGADDAELMTRLAGLDEELAILLEAARNLALPVQAEAQAPLGDMGEVEAALADLLDLLQNNNLKAMGNFEALRTALAAALAPATVASLGEAIESLSFAHAATQVQDILNRKGTP